MTFAIHRNIAGPFALSLTLSLGFLSPAPARADVFAWSQSPPGGLAAAKVPMIVSFGFDDNARVEGVAWFADLVRNRKNHSGTGNPQTFDGTPVRATWFLTANYTAEGFVTAGTQTAQDVIQSWKGLVSDGHEIANHTWDHPHGSGLDVAGWKDQIQRSNDHLIKILGIQASDIKGFRTPFLEYSTSTLTALKDLGFLYDCSIEFGFNGWQPQAGDSGNWNSMVNPETHKKLWWPYTLDQGSPPGNASKGNPMVPGLWEIPVNTYLKPDNSAEVTGFDFNLWKVMDKATFVAALKHNFDLRRAGNRAPLTVNVHSDYYTQHNEDANKEFLLADHKQRQAAMEEFLAYILQFPDVRVVPYKSMISWMKNPVALATTPGTVSRSDLKAAALTSRLTAGGALELTLPGQGIYSLTVVSAQGRVLERMTRGFVKGEARVQLASPLRSGIYFVQLSDGTHSVRQRMLLSR
jgi:hypothetical protein